MSKPSERIKEIQDTLESPLDRLEIGKLESIIQYLDEEYEKKESKYTGGGAVKTLEELGGNPNAI